MGESRKAVIAVSSAVLITLVGLSPAVGVASDESPSPNVVPTIDATATPSPSELPVETATPSPSEPEVVANPSAPPSWDVASPAPSASPQPSEPADFTWYPSLTDVDVPTGKITEESADAFTRIDRDLFRKHPDEWGGAYQGDHALYVKTVTRSVGEAAKVIEALGVGGDIKIVQVSTSIADFEAMQRAVADSEVWKQLMQIGPEYGSSSLLVGVREGVEPEPAIAAVRAVLRSAGGDDWASIPIIAFGGAPIQDLSRFYDTSPFKGGAHAGFGTSSSVVFACSTAFTWYKSPYTYMISAGHCARLTNGSQYNYVSRRTPVGTYFDMGTVPWASIDTNGTISGRHGDFSMVRLNSGLTGDSRVYANADNTTASRAVKNFGNLQLGSIGTLRTSGASCMLQPPSDCEAAPNNVIAMNQLITNTEGRDYIGMTVARDPDDCTYPGDSGGALYTQRSDGGANAVGILSGVSPSSSICQSYFTPVMDVYEDFGGALYVE